MRRRDFLKSAATVGSPPALPAPAFGPEPEIVKPLPRQAGWRDFELGRACHFDLDVYMPGGRHHERSRREQLDAGLYNPARLDTDQWLEVAKLRLRVTRSLAEPIRPSS